MCLIRGKEATFLLVYKFERSGALAVFFAKDKYYKPFALRSKQLKLCLKFGSCIFFSCEVCTTFGLK